MEESATEDFASYRAGLSSIRKRRRYLWALIIVYLPMMWLAQKVTGSFNGAMPVFGVWCVLLIVAVSFLAVVKCPRCGNLFHVNGMTMLVLRRCLHCQLRLDADRKK